MGRVKGDRMTTAIQYALGAAAVIAAAWPQIKELATSVLSDDKTVPAPNPLREAVSPNYQTAIADLASVRLRLVHTDGLGDPQKAAIDTLTLALVAGSDK
jgi:hypothetical protein